jgi:hypothetical protein
MHLKTMKEPVAVIEILWLSVENPSIKRPVGKKSKFETKT